jgi:DNA-binding transcriptional regulator GbsR (MarR family)
MKRITRTAATSRAVDGAQLLGWAERVATFFAEHYGLPPITGRILGWLMICDPTEQSAGEIADAIGASRASLTTNMRFLIASGLVRRLTRPGGRTSYYRIDDGMWDAVVRRRISSMVSFSQITLDGMNLVGANSARAARLRAAHEFFDWMATLLTKTSGPRGGAG